MSTPQEDSMTSLSRRSRRKPEQPPGSAEAEGTALPSRRKKHPSNKVQTVRWFYNTLIILFLLLMAGLLWFGRELANG